MWEMAVVRALLLLARTTVVDCALGMCMSLRSTSQLTLGLMLMMKRLRQILAPDS